MLLNSLFKSAVGKIEVRAYCRSFSNRIFFYIKPTIDIRYSSKVMAELSRFGFGLTEDCIVSFYFYYSILR